MKNLFATTRSQIISLHLDRLFWLISTPGGRPRPRPDEIFCGMGYLKYIYLNGPKNAHYRKEKKL